MVYRIYESILPALEKKLVRIQNKANKYGCNFHYEQIGEEYREIRDEKGFLNTLRFVFIDVSGTAIINNWEFIAGIDHKRTRNIIRNISGEPLPEHFRNCSSYCEHCKIDRYRKQTYVIRNTKTKEYKQVGSACLMDYTHGLNAELAAAMMEGITSLESYQNNDNYFSGGGFKKYWNVKALIPFIAETTNIFGYSKTDSQLSTRDRVIDFYDILYRGRHSTWTEQAEKEIEETGFNPDSEYATTTAKNALAWIAEKDSNSEYIHNLKTICKMDYVEYNHLGILCSLISAYNRDMEYNAKKEAKEKAEKTEGIDSKWIYEVGQRITIDIKDTKCLTSYFTQFGTTYIYRFISSDNNIYIWKTAKMIENIQKITGTVKELSEYNGVKQTVLTRCRI